MSCAICSGVDAGTTTALQNGCASPIIMTCAMDRHSDNSASIHSGEILRPKLLISRFFLRPTIKIKPSLSI